MYTHACVRARVCTYMWIVLSEWLLYNGKRCASPLPPSLPPLQTLSNISALLERANSVYERLVDHRHTLDKLLSQVSSSSDSLPTTSVPVHAVTTSSRSAGGHYIMVAEGHPASSGAEGVVNRSIQVQSEHQ